MSVTDVSRCKVSYAKTLGLKDVQFPNVAASSMFHPGKDKLFVHQYSIGAYEVPPYVQKRTQLS